MIRPNRYRYEGPVAGIAGSLIGGMIGGGGTLAGMATVGGLVGSAIGGLVGSTILGGSQQPSINIASPNVPAAVPPTPGLPTQPNVNATLPSPVTNTPSGTGSALTPAEIAAGQSADAARRGRLATILTQNPLAAGAGAGNEKLG